MRVWPCGRYAQKETLPFESVDPEMLSPGGSTSLSYTLRSIGWFVKALD